MEDGEDDEILFDGMVELRPVDTTTSSEAAEAVERPFKCPFCPKRFREKKYMNRHTKEKHPDSVEKPMPLYKCVG